jgi:hypothetical protein
LSEVFCRSVRHAVKVGSINAQRASDRSLGYGSRCCEVAMGILMHEASGRDIARSSEAKANFKGVFEPDRSYRQEPG